MSKTLLKFTGIFSLCITLLVGSSFTIHAYENAKVVYIPTTITKFMHTYSYDYEAAVTTLSGTFEVDDIQAYIYDLHNINVTSSNQYSNIDESYPLFICASTTNTSSYTGLSNTLSCFPVDDLSNLAVNQTSNLNTYVDFMAILTGATTTLPYNACVTQYKTLIDLGYRFYRVSTHVWNGTTYYLYVLARFKNAENIDFNQFSGDISMNFSTQAVYVICNMEFVRLDLSVYTQRLSDNTLYKYEGGYIANVSFTSSDTGWSPDSSYYIYESNDIIIQSYMTNTEMYTFTITGPNPYITFCKERRMATSETYNTSVISGTTSGWYYKESTDMTGVNEKLTEIIDLLEDFEVQQINNIYQDIQNNYDIDIDLTLNNLIDDLDTNIHSVDFDNEAYDPTNQIFQKASDFKIIFTNMVNTMQTSGIGIMYFLPFVLIVIGILL